MAQLDSTIGVVHWAALQVLGDGEGLHIVVPADFEQYHEPYLQSVLPSRLSSIIADERVKVEARGGECNANGWEKAGEIVVGPGVRAVAGRGRTAPRPRSGARGGRRGRGRAAQAGARATTAPAHGRGAPLPACRRRVVTDAGFPPLAGRAGELARHGSRASVNGFRRRRSPTPRLPPAAGLAAGHPYRVSGRSWRVLAVWVAQEPRPRLITRAR